MVIGLGQGLKWAKARPGSNRSYFDQAYASLRMQLFKYKAIVNGLGQG